MSVDASERNPVIENSCCDEFLKKFKCNICNRALTTRYNLERHIKTFHDGVSEDATSNMEECNEKCDSKSKLLRRSKQGDVMDRGTKAMEISKAKDAVKYSEKNASESLLSQTKVKRKKQSPDTKRKKKNIKKLSQTTVKRKKQDLHTKTNLNNKIKTALLRESGNEKLQTFTCNKHKIKKVAIMLENALHTLTKTVIPSLSKKQHH